MRTQRGVTLLEMLIAITLVAGLSTGMLMAMRTSLLTYEKTAKKLESNRHFVKAQQILSSQISAVIAVSGVCPAVEGPGIPVPSFLSGSVDRLRFISSYSIAEGARGYPQIVEYRVLSGDRGSVRLVATERPYTGPQSTIPFCTGTALSASPFEFGAANQASAKPTPETSYVLADHLAYCRFSYHEPYDQNTFLETPWLPQWDRPVVPAGVRLEMQPTAPERGGLSALGMTIPIQVNRDPAVVYDDGF
jgi:prepilin-type N-terminal cleavage/methylation domain-containing protein